MKNLITAFILSITLFSFVYGQGSWTQKAIFGGDGRWLPVGFSINGKGYVGTGEKEIGMEKKDFWAYDPSTDTWTQKADFGGEARSDAVGFSIGNKGYIGLGGMLNWDTGFYFNFRDFWEYDPQTNSWTERAYFTFDGGVRNNTVGFSIGNKGYIGTGDRGPDFYRDFWEYDPDNDTWTKKADFPGIERSIAVGFSIGSYGYIGLGWLREDGSDLFPNDFWKYDPSLDTWTQIADFGGDGRWLPVGFSINGKGYVGMGGSEDSEPFKDFWEYDPSTNTWTQKADFGGEGRTDAAGFSIDGKGYVGLGRVGNSLKKDFWEYDPEEIDEIEITLENIDIHDHLGERLNEYNTFYYLVDLAVETIPGISDEVFCDATLYLTFNKPDKIEDIKVHLSSPDDPDYSYITPAFQKNDNYYHHRFELEVHKQISISSIMDIFSILASSFHPVGTVGHVFKEHGFFAPRAVVDQIIIIKKDGSEQVIEVDIELPSYDKHVANHYEQVHSNSMRLQITSMGALLSPLNIIIEDDDGYKIGEDEQGMYKEIPYSLYINHEDKKYYFIITSENYDIYLNAYDEGTFTFSYDYFPTGNIDDLIGIHYENVPTGSNSRFWVPVDKGDDEFLMYIDEEGDGSYDQSRSPDSIVTNVEYFTQNNDDYQLFQNYPNPFNPSTLIRYAIPERSYVTLTVFNSLGQKVATLVSEEQEAQFYEITFDASHLPSGVYIYRLQAGKYVESRKMLYLK